MICCTILRSTCPQEMELCIWILGVLILSQVTGYEAQSLFSHTMILVVGGGTVNFGRIKE